MSDQQRPVWALRLRAEREARQWGPFETARQLREAVGITEHPGNKVKSLAALIIRHEKGQVFPTDWAAAYSIAYETTRTDLFGEERGERDNPRPARRIEGASRVPDVTVEEKTDPDQGDDVKRRELLHNAATLTAGATLAPVLAALSQSWQDSEPTLPGASVSQSMIDDWENAYDVHSATYRYATPAVVLAALAADWTEMAPHLRRNQPDAVGRDLAHAVARHAFLIAGAFSEIGDRRHAQRWWDKSRNLADKSQDRGLASKARSWEVTTRLSTYRQDPHSLVPMAQEARHLAGTSPSFPLIYAAAVEAETYAAIGDRQRAVAALREVEALFDRLPAEGPQYSEGALRYVQSQVYSWAGDAKAAGEAQGAARPCIRSDEYLGLQLNLHVAALHARTDPEQALAHAIHIVDALPQERRVARVLSNARKVVTALPENARALPATRELQALTAGI